MHFLHHRQRSQCHVLPLPEGLQELMADISREVLRCQPSIDCMYKFIADYLDAIIATREKSQIAMGIIEEAILSTDEIYSQFLKCNIPKDKTDNFLEVLEKTFRRFVEQKRRMSQDPRFITFQADDLLDELLRKCDLTKVEILRSRPAIQWAYKKFVETYISAIEGTLDVADLYANANKLISSCKEFEQLEKSAVTIQKTYRGYYTRKNKQRLVQEQVEQKKVIKVEQIDHEEKSALTIQKHYRGYKVRRKLQPKPEMVDRDDSFEHFKRYARDNEDLNKAAVKIQATYKGFHTRKKMNGHRKSEDH